jgi:hypothetical protein
MDVTTPPAVEVEIGELSLIGLGPHDATALQSAVECHLSNLLRDTGLPPGTATGPAGRGHVAVDLDWDGRGGEDALARLVARRIYEAIGS